MKNSVHRLLVAAAVFAVALPLLAGGFNSEQELLAALDSPKEKDVVSALQGFEKDYPTSTAAMAKAKVLLGDPRMAVHRKAARVLGVLHADVSDADLKNIAALLDSPAKDDVLDGLKALRGLKAQSVVPKIVPLLKNPDANIKRDSCRTLAVIGSKDNVADIEPLLQDPEKAVVKDANDAIFALKSK
jgi:HEAT repeat protein